MDMIYKMFRADVKGVNADEGTLDILIPVSTASIDRDGEVVEPLAFKKTLPKFMKRPVLVASHDYRDLTSQIGEWAKLKITEDGVEGKPKYYINEGNEQADWGFKLASRGMAAFSIGFIPKVWEDGDGVKEPRRTYKEVELLEISQVIVPSNREAIQSIRAKSVDPIVTEICDEVEKELEPEVVTKPEPDITENYIRLRQRDPGDFQEGSFRTITISAREGIKAVIGRLKGETTTTVQSYLFDKDKWTVERARAWVREHEKSIFILDDEYPKIHQTSQSEIMDEIDYLKTLIEKEGLSEKTKEPTWNLIKAILRLSGDDIPVDIIDFLRLIPVEPTTTDVIKKDSITYQEIQEAIKRIANKLEVK